MLRYIIPSRLLNNKGIQDQPHKTLFGCFIRDRNAVASIEFAFITPVLVFFMLGAVAAFDVVQGGKNYSNAAKTVVDLVTRQTTFSDDDLTLQVAIVEAIMEDYADVPDLEVRVTSIYSRSDEDDEDDDDDEEEESELEDVELVVDWSVSNVDGSAMNDAALANFSKLPYVPVGETIVLVEVSGTYSPYISTDFIGDMEYYRYAIRRPRFSTSVEYLN